MLMSGEIEKFRICQKFNLEVPKMGRFYLKRLKYFSSKLKYFKYNAKQATKQAPRAASRITAQRRSAPRSAAQRRTVQRRAAPHMMKSSYHNDTKFSINILSFRNHAKFSLKFS